MAKTLFEKLWDQHCVVQATESTPAVIYIDLHLVHEVTSPQAFSVLKSNGLKVRQPARTVATMDHSIPTKAKGADGKWPFVDAMAAKQVEQLEANCAEHGVRLFALGGDHQGIVHVIGPELGLTQPGMTICCGDSHTSTHGAFGAWAFGIGTTEVSHVLATQCLLQRRPKTFSIEITGTPSPQVTAKDIVLAIIAEIGVDGGTGHVLEYRGSAIRSLSMESRMTVCNMSIEGGARAGLIAPDDTTYEYLANCAEAPKGADWDAALARWRALPTDEGATFDRSLTLDGSKLAPMITYGTNPSMAIPLGGTIPEPNGDKDIDHALRYMGLAPGKPLSGQKVDVVFIGSCTNSRIQDLREAASVFDGRKVADGMRALVVPGSQVVKKQAEAEGLDRIFRDAGAEWREPGCSMCIAMNGDQLQPGQYAVSTSNRNFEGRQGPGGRTFLASPTVAATTAVVGAVPALDQLPAGGA